MIAVQVMANEVGRTNYYDAPSSRRGDVTRSFELFILRRFTCEPAIATLDPTGMHVRYTIADLNLQTVRRVRTIALRPAG
jgi:hypothetical protein